MLFRAFYALPDSIKGADGQPVNALLGTANLILREVEQHGPRAVVLCFGPDAADYRVELFDGYHAQRPEVPDGLVPQFAGAREFFEAFGWTVAVSDTLEADDLLGAYARREAAAGGRVLVMTGDRDMFQCASERVSILYVRTGGKGAELVDPADVRRGQGHRREDRRRAAPAPRLAGDRARACRPRDQAERARRALHSGRRATPLQGDRHAA